MSPEKGSVDQKPSVQNSTTRIPGQVGWGIERSHLLLESKLITDDTSVPSYPIKKDHVADFDKNKTALFTRHHGERAAEIDKKLGVDY